MKEIVIFILGMNAGIGLLYIFNATIRNELKKYFEWLDA